MLEPNLGIDTTDRREQMATGHDSLADQLAAMREAALAGAARLSEMSETGFTTNTPFDNVCQPQYVEEGGMPFLLVSGRTNTTYFVLVMERVGADLRVVVAVHQGQNPNMEHLRKMTLKRGQDGSVHATPGW